LPADGGRSFLMRKCRKRARRVGQKEWEAIFGNVTLRVGVTFQYLGSVALCLHNDDNRDGSPLLRIGCRQRSLVIEQGVGNLGSGEVKGLGREGQGERHYV
jgi:hypothetical protein